jgi:hypothetical protein
MREPDERNDLVAIGAAAIGDLVARLVATL